MATTRFEVSNSFVSMVKLNLLLYSQVERRRSLGQIHRIRKSPVFPDSMNYARADTTNITISPSDTDALLDTLKTATEHLTNMAKGLEFPWDDTDTDPRRAHNMYVRNLVTSYVSRFSELSTGILDSAGKSNFLIYALCGRGLIEMTATLRFYVLKKYKPLLQSGSLDYGAMERLVKIDDQHLRGSRFNWEAFLFKNYSELREEVTKHLQAKRKKKVAQDVRKLIVEPQINVLTCLEHWGLETPEVLVTYNLFCDLVHPNIGSNMLVASTTSDGLFFSRFRGDMVGQHIFEQSLPWLLACSHKAFGKLLVYLIGTCWAEDELD